MYSARPNGGEPVGLTSASRHELSPELSVDGTRIAFASNKLGNMDLFTMPVAGGDAEHLQIEEPQFRGRSGKVRLTVVDEMDRPTAARLYVEASDGKGYAPRGEPIFYYPLEPGGKRDAFFVAIGSAEFDVPTGPLKLTTVRGFEYRLIAKTVDVESDGTTEVTLKLERWTNWSQTGWYSGENHFHANYLGCYYQQPTQSPAWLKAMALNAANMIVANAEESLSTTRRSSLAT